MKLNNGTLELNADEVRNEIDAFWEERVIVFTNDLDTKPWELRMNGEDTYRLDKGEFLAELAYNGQGPEMTMYELSSVQLDDDLAKEYGDDQYPLYDAEFEMDYDYFNERAEKAWDELKSEVKTMNIKGIDIREDSIEVRAA